MGYVFEKNYRSDHEPVPMGLGTLYVLCEHADGRVSERALRSFLYYRDKVLGLEFESSLYLYRVIDVLEKMFPKSKFVLTVREPMSWLESAVNQSIKAKVEKHWRAYENRVYGSRGNKFYHDKVKRLGAYPIRSYLDYWNEHIRRVMDTVPPKRLCVVNTFDIDEELERVAQFVGADPARIDYSQSRSGKRKEEWVTIERDLDESWVRRQTVELCGETVREYVPFLRKDMGYLDAAV
ncbi:hypothetical protein GGP48_002925 [Salinibacter ruber]|nr:sulfotransferase [Salinibacter ruber]MCS4188211.1 hypothetical protein [Salinibacter ruber]